MLTSKEIEKSLTKLKQKLHRDFFVNRIGYFGSFSTNQQNENSDIDILVEFEKPIGWEFFDLQDLLEKEFNKKIDLVSTKALKKQLKEHILNQVKYI